MLRNENYYRNRSGMELLVATLAHTAANKDVDGMARLRFISETVLNAPGLVNARFYRSREPESYYFMLTTWEDEEFWYRAQDRYDPKNLLVGSAGELLTVPPEQWLMRYLWGYSRPSAQPTIAAAHVVTVRPDQAERVERSWIEELRRQVAQPTLAFAFLARGRNADSALSHDPSTLNNKKATEGSYDTHSSNFLNLLSWPGETQRKDFYTDQNYKAISGFLSSVGVVRALALDPL
jgi:heme-degrading monooxygenase HmoA